ncbi:hypothetical protein XENTR_v10014027 [Xenopus tropicalis]|nr:hypothetical protein XENTR_v10014027 [Xenopus tropicalis]
MRFTVKQKIAHNMNYILSPSESQVYYQATGILCKIHVKGIIKLKRKACLHTVGLAVGIEKGLLKRKFCWLEYKKDQLSLNALV